MFKKIASFLLFLISLTTPSKAVLISPGKKIIPTPTPFPATPAPLTLDNIFSTERDQIIKNFPQEKVLTIITTGDIIPARTVNYKMTVYNDFTHPFKKTAEILRSADLTLINLEAPLIENCPITNQGMIFCGNQRFIEGLKFADIDVVNLANNHILNYGQTGLKQTIELLEKNNILPTAFSNSLKIKKFNNFKIGFLGWNLLEKFNQNEILKQIKEADEKVDLLIASAHWGAEYTHQPAQWQKNLARQMVDQGADLICGNHPHWVQPIEIYNNKLIIYSHGNFIFDQEWSRQTKTGYIVKSSFYQNKLVDIQLFPVLISDYNQPELLKDEEKEKVLEKIKKPASP